MAYLNEERQRRLELQKAREDAEKYRIWQESIECFVPARLFNLTEAKSRQVPRLIELLNTNPKITMLYIGYSNIDNHAIKMLSEKLKYVTKLILDSVDLGFEDNHSTQEALLALAQSNIRQLTIQRTMMTNEESDILIQHSRQTMLEITCNRHVDEKHVKKAEKKARENSENELKFFGSATKKHKQDPEKDQNPQIESPPDQSPE